MKATICTFLWARITILTVIVVGWAGQAAASPQIITQPQPLAVDLGEAATFSVSVNAGGGSNLTYQWQINGIELFGATAPSLTIDEVKRSDLGLYTVTIADSTGFVTSQPVALKLARWMELVCFGSSTSMAQYSNGPSWVDRLADSLGIRPPHYRNYAMGMANNASVASQITACLNDNQPTDRTLCAFWTGGAPNELVRGNSMNTAMTGHMANIQRLIDAGARVFLIPRLFPGKLIPAFRASYPHVTNELSLEYDRILDERLEALKQTYGITVYRPDMFQFFNEIWTEPEAYGFTDLNGSAQSSPGNDDEFFFWDGAHFTQSANLIISGEIYRQFMVEAERVALLQTEQAWAAATAGSDPEDVLSFLYDNAVLYPGDGPAVHGTSEILVFQTASRTIPGFHQILAQEEAYVSPAGDLGYAVGQFETFSSNSEEIPLVASGRYVNVWRRDADGNWKNSLAIYSPLSPPTPGEGTLSEPSVAELPAPRWPDPSPDIDMETQRAVLLETDQDLAEAMTAGIAAGQFDAMSAFFKEDAIFFPAGSPAIDGKSAIRAFFEANTLEPDSTLTTVPFEAQVSRSGDLGHTLGIYQSRFDGTEESPLVLGVYLSVWEKDIYGNWMIIMQIHSPTGTQD
jgi:ketosteroid isomerase-like protein